MKISIIIPSSTVDSDVSLEIESINGNNEELLLTIRNITSVKTIFVVANNLKLAVDKIIEVVKV